LIKNYFRRSAPRSAITFFYMALRVRPQAHPRGMQPHPSFGKDLLIAKMLLVFLLPYLVSSASAALAIDVRKEVMGCRSRAFAVTLFARVRSSASRELVVAMSADTVAMLGTPAMSSAAKKSVGVTPSATKTRCRARSLECKTAS